MSEPSSPIRPSPCALVLFGATGDLTRRKLVPALFSLSVQGLLPERFAIVAYARRPMDTESFREELREAVREFAPDLSPSGERWDRFASSIAYLQGQLDDPQGYRHLAERLAVLDEERGLGGNYLFYLATPPESVGTIVDSLGAAGLTASDPGTGWRRIVVEKPFGSNLESARALNVRLHRSFAESQIYRIDHYLGKETVQNILVLRFANRLFELLWNHLYIESVQITVAETLGMEGRGPTFDRSGTLRDIVQNHALQLLTLVAMEPPVSLEADAIRDEKVKVLRSIRTFRPEDIKSSVVRGQYTKGQVGEETVPGYLDEEGIQAGSRTETFVALRCWVDNWRWAGVPFYVRAGKRMPARLTEIVLQLREIPGVLFARMSCSELLPNLIRFRIQPDEGAEIFICAKRPGTGMQVEPVKMDFNYADRFEAQIPDAYERLLINAMLGDAALFAREDEVEAAWRLLTPVLDAWSDRKDPPQPYFAGTWGPSAAADLLRPSDQIWWNGGPELKPFELGAGQ